MKVSAFALMRKSASKRGSGPGPEATQAQQEEATFELCPVCGQCFSKSVMQQHANACLDERANKRQRSEDAQGCRRPSQSGISATPETSKASTGAVPLATATTGEPVLQSLRPTMSSAAQQAAAQKAPNAFAHLMDRQRQCSQVHTFYLEGIADGSWRWHMWCTTGKSTTSSRGQDTSGEGQQQSLPAQAMKLSGGPVNVDKAWTATSQVSGEALGVAGGGKVAVRLITNEPAEAGGAVIWTQTGMESNAEGRTFKGAPSLLKSALQKNVRLGRAGSAVRCALQLLKDDAGELLRRLSIICLEDAILHPELPLIVWLMMAHAKGFQLGWRHADACLAIVAQLATVSVRDCWPSHEAGAAAVRQQPACLGGQGACSRRAAADVLVCAIAIRAAFGGMKGDVAMLRAFAAVWKHRFSGQGQPPPSAVDKPPDSPSASADGQWLPHLQQLYDSLQCPREPVQSIGPLQRSDVPLSAVDFHVSSIAPSLLQDPGVAQAAAACVAAGQASDAESAMQKAMWRHSSSISHKQEIGGTERCPPESPELSRLWAAAACAAEQWSAAFIRTKFT